MTCKACGLPEPRYAICDRWRCEHMLPRQTLEAACGTCFVLSPSQAADIEATGLRTPQVIVDQVLPTACSQCGKYPCECDDC